MKRKYRPVVLILGIVLIIAGLAFIRLRNQPAVIATPETELVLVSDTQTVTLGSEFSVTLQVKPNNNSIILVEPHITYDPSVVELISIEPSGPFINVVSSTSISNGKGTISVATSSPQEPVQQDADAALLKFRALQSGNSFISLDENSFIGSLVPSDKTTNMMKKYTGLNIAVQAN